MFRQLIFPCESFVAFVALERPLTCVHLYVALQFIRSYTIVVAMVTLDGLLSYVHPYYVNFQITLCYAGKLARCASVWLFSRVDHFVLLQIE